MAHPAFTENVIPELLAWRRAGRRAALVTLIGVEGAGPRPIGSQMAVRDDGAAVGMISSGCAEAAVVAEAVAALEAGRPRTVRYGAGSRYIDVVLPCGSGIDVTFDPLVPLEVLEAISAAQSSRRSVSLAIDPEGKAPARLFDARPGTRPDAFIRRYDPAPRLLIAGRGPILELLALNAALLEWETVLVSPDTELLARNARLARSTSHLTRPDDFDPTGLVDAATAVVLLFHDHEWEPEILARTEHTPAFYFGALGSRRTHGVRKGLLERRGCSKRFIEAIRSPIGLPVGGKSPPEIAVAIVAEILAALPVQPLSRVSRAEEASSAL